MIVPLQVLGDVGALMTAEVTVLFMMVSRGRAVEFLLKSTIISTVLSVLSSRFTLDSGSREQWTLCNDNVNWNTVHARSTLLMSRFSESGVLTKKEMQNMQSGGGGENWN